MIDDKLFERFPKPDVIFGQHVTPPAAGQISYRLGVTQSEEDSTRCGCSAGVGTEHGRSPPSIPS
jgi:hypothetical protein